MLYVTDTIFDEYLYSILTSNPHSTDTFLDKPWKPKVFFQFEGITIVTVSSFRLIWIPTLWVYGHYRSVYYYTVRGSTLAAIIWRLQTSDSDD